MHMLLQLLLLLYLRAVAARDCCGLLLLWRLLRLVHIGAAQGALFCCWYCCV